MKRSSRAWLRGFRPVVGCILRRHLIRHSAPARQDAPGSVRTSVCTPMATRMRTRDWKVVGSPTGGQPPRCGPVSRPGSEPGRPRDQLLQSGVVLCSGDHEQHATRRANKAPLAQGEALSAWRPRGGRRHPQVVVSGRSSVGGSASQSMPARLLPAVRETEPARRKPPLDGATHGGPPAPAFRVAEALLVPRVVDPLQHGAAHAGTLRRNRELGGSAQPEPGQARDATRR